jgi:hypothetical protein
MNLLCGLVLLGAAGAQQEAPDPILARVKEVMAQPLPPRPETLAKNLTQGLTKDEEKLAAIQYWVIESLTYDDEGLSRGRAIYDAATCYRQKRGVCQAIAELFVQMGRAVGVSVESAAGEARELVFTKDGPKSDWVPHAWVRYRSPKGIKWIDPTFSLPGAIKGKVTPGLGWFLLDPKQMASSHRPTLNRQGSEPLLDRAAVELLPSWDWGALRQHGLLPPAVSTEPKEAGRLGFTWPAAEGVEFLARIYQVSGDVEVENGQAIALRQGRSVRFTFAPKSRGWHKAVLFVKKSGSSEMFRSVGTLPLMASEDVKKASVPLLFADFSSMGVEVVSGGESGELPTETDLELKYKMSGEGTLVIFPKKEGGLLSSDVLDFRLGSDGVWAWKGRLTKGEWILGVKLPNSNRIKFLAQYKVVDEQVLKTM